MYISHVNVYAQIYMWHICTHVYVDIYAWKDCENNPHQQTSKKEIEHSCFCALAGAYISISMTKSKR